MEYFSLKRFLKEDKVWRSITEEIVSGKKAKGEILTRENGILAGIEEVTQIFKKLDIKVKKKKQNSEKISQGEVLIAIEGPADSLLRAERLTLNILASMSGIATATRKCVKKSGDTKVAATRKTTPGYRYFEKKAVKIGGGDTHRQDLSSSILIKDNHIKILGLQDAIEKVKEKASFTTKIEIEVETLNEAKKAAKSEVDIILLDNMGPEKIKKCVNRLPNDLVLEASGNITPENIEDYASTGVDVVSMGILTPSSWLDISMNIK